MKKWRSICLIVILIVSPTTYAEPKKIDSSIKPTLRDVMHDFVNYLTDAKAFSISETNIKDEDSAKTDRAIEKLKTSLDKIDPSQLPPSQAYNISLKALQQHFLEIERAYKFGNKYYGRWMLNATGSLCIMCHAQVPSSSRTLQFNGPYKNPQNGEQQFSQAEFLFTTRQFEQAMKIYDELVAQYPKNGLNSSQLDTVLRHRVTYFARIKRDPVDGMSRLTKDLTNKNIPDPLSKNLSAWVALFRKWGREDIAADNASAKDILKYAQTEMKKTLWDRMSEANDPRVVTYLKVSGVLYNYLFTHPSSNETPEILLWLGRCENALNNQFFYSLGDLYYKECIENFSSSAAAKECYRELETSIKKVYAPITGAEVPPFIEVELKAYRKRLGM